MNRSFRCASVRPPTSCHHNTTSPLLLVTGVVPRLGLLSQLGRSVRCCCLGLCCGILILRVLKKEIVYYSRYCALFSWKATKKSDERSACGNAVRKR
ncbi:hypothetical protein ABB37_05536 [Leptomonas pyrrhocoris]|uniref:Uncharacterized protein n=1 Tax=Leptomonas pyrrhocoris TaxID=157538 RepID=A0A0M9FZA9_LEPPY|nr:hypothetical protein ABB37_05536 [Leptomonas pyrrhocoris]KPA78987.1 hypothetical protein ABB37_05536 [Leptomonas pyrrhocoris]|eukprot:XP_015657426.1 hypothetical protein ABB37_05536 [Leptomonas pyrrhocoris]